ncbi:MAG: hypothetical protein HYS74_01840 [Parcubacteria group bacterium]|nr:hypothetical protein [Parcubacteria group bacterium]
MRTLHYQKQSGLVKLILLVIFVILVLSYFSIDVRGIVESEQSQKNFTYVWGWVVFVWDRYLGEPVRYVWNNIVVNLLWESFVSNLERIKRGAPNDFELMAPQAP